MGVNLRDSSQCTVVVSARQQVSQQRCRQMDNTPQTDHRYDDGSSVQGCRTLDTKLLRQ